MALAVRLMYGGAGLTALALVIDVATAGSQRAIVEAAYREAHAGQELRGIDLGIAVKYAVIALIIGASIRLVLWLWMAWQNGRARPWARVVGTIFGVINLGSLSYLAKETLGSQVITVVDVVLGVVVTVLMWRRDSTAAYDADPSC